MIGIFTTLPFLKVQLFVVKKTQVLISGVVGLARPPLQYPVRLPLLVSSSIANRYFKKGRNKRNGFSRVKIQQYSVCGGSGVRHRPG